MLKVEWINVSGREEITKEGSNSSVRNRYRSKSLIQVALATSKKMDKTKRIY